MSTTRASRLFSASAMSLALITLIINGPSAVQSYYLKGHTSHSILGSASFPSFGEGDQFVNHFDKLTDPTYLQQVSSYGLAFLQGANADSYAANSTNCFNRTLHIWFYELPLIQWRYYYGNFDDVVFNSTKFVANSTNAAMVCFDVVENMAIFVANKFELFPDFTSFLMGFFQNLLGSVTQLVNIYKNISSAVESGNLIPIFQQLGKAARILLDFQPIDTGARITSSKPQPIYEHVSMLGENKYELFELKQNAATPTIPSEPGYLQVLSFNGAIGFLRGAMNGTRALSTNQMYICQDTLVNKWDGNAVKIWNQTLEGHLFKAGWAALDAIYNVDPITQACYRSMKEFGIGFYSNLLLLDPRTVIDNIVYQFGNIFDSIRDVVLFFTDDARGEFNLPYDAGYGLGNALYLLLKPKVQVVDDSQ